MNKHIKILIIILSVCFVSGFLICANSNQALSAYDFEGSTGLTDTAKQTGHVESGITNKEMPEVIGDIIGAILAFVGVLFLILMIYGGYIWMMARGNEQETEKAKKIIQNALIGIVVVLAAYAITYTIFSNALYKMST